MASSSTTLALCSSLTSHCKIISHHQNSSIPFLSKPSLSLSKPKSIFSSDKFAFSSSIVSTGLEFSHIPKFSQSETSVIESEPDTLKPEPAQVVETAKEQTKREEIFAVVMIGSRQYIVFPGRYLYTQRLKGANVNDKIILNKVLLVGTKESTYIGKPVVTNAAVHAVVEEQGLNPKVVVFKYKKKKNYRRNIGHRQPNTRIRITGITGYQDYPAASLNS